MTHVSNMNMKLTHYNNYNCRMKHKAKLASLDITCYNNYAVRNNSLRTETQGVDSLVKCMRQTL